MPPPDVLREFQEAVPGSVDLILQEFKEQGTHRRTEEQRENKAHSFALRAISISVSALPFATLAAGTYLAVHGEIWLGAATIGVQIGVQLITKIRSRESD